MKLCQYQEFNWDFTMHHLKLVFHYKDFEVSSDIVFEFHFQHVNNCFTRKKKIQEDSF